MNHPNGRALVLVAQPQAETAAQRTARLHGEARFAAIAQVDDHIAAILRLAASAADIAEGGEVFPPGARDLCRRMAEDLTWKAQTLEQIARSAGK